MKFRRALRQMGDQEAPIVEMARPITKFSHLVLSADEIETAATDAWKAATSGRPGPVWIDVPIDLQGAKIEAPAPIAAADVDDHDWDDPETVSDQILEALDNAERPIIIAGNGVRIFANHDDAP